MASNLTNFDGALGTETAVLLTRKNLRYAEQLMKRHFDWHSFSGYVFPPTAKPELPGLLGWGDFNQRIERRLRAVREQAIYFEDAADGCALKLWFLSKEEASVKRALRLRLASLARPTRQ
jgi:hypothetical protein